MFSFPKLPPSLLVALGILASRLSGLVRNKIFAYYFGDSEFAGIFRAAQRIPNFLQNLLGEGALSASFIPAYSRLLAEKRDEEAGKLAGAIFGLLGVVVSVLVLIGILAAPVLTRVIALGFTGKSYDLTVQLVRIFFPGIGVLVLSAWCLGILNSHRKFLLPYAAPVMMNLAVIVALVAFGKQSSEQLVVTITWAATVGSLLVFAVQLPAVLRLVKGLKLSVSTEFAETREVIRNFLPALVSRGVAQISGYVDGMISSLISERAVGVLAFAQDLYMLPVSLFGIAISASELPALSSALGTDEEIAAQIRTRLESALRRVSFFVIPSLVAFLALGDQIINVLYRGGRFGAGATAAVWATLAGSTVGLLAATKGRLFSSTFYALRDTRTPLKFAVARVTFGALLGTFAALYGPGPLGLDRQWGIVGLAAASGAGGWLEYFLLKRALTGRIGHVGVPASFTFKLWMMALAAALMAWLVKLALGHRYPFPVAVIVLGTYGLMYLGSAFAQRVPEVEMIRRRFLKGNRGQGSGIRGKESE